MRDWAGNGLPDVPLAWLTTVARNLLLNHQRRSVPVSIDVLPPELLPAAPDADSCADELARSTAVVDALTRMPAEEARLLEAFHFEPRARRPGSRP